MTRKLAPFVAIAALSGVVSALAAGCGGEPSEQCQTYVACARHYDKTFGIEPPTDTAPYEEGGDCWANQSLYDTCNAHCADATNSLIAALSAAGEDTGPCE